MTHLPTPGRARSRLILLSAGTIVAGVLAAMPTAQAVPLGTAVATPSPALKASSTKTYTAGRYVVLLRQAPAAAYRGSNPRFAGMRSGGQFRGDTAALRAYAASLRSAHRSLADEVGTSVVEDYTVASNGFVADLTQDQALELATDRRVLMIEKQQLLKPDTWNTPKFLGLDGPKGSWTTHGGREKAGSGVVVGVIDSGIWPESKSFAGKPLTGTPQERWDITRKGESVRMEKAGGGVFHGQCTIAPKWNAGDCSTKLVSARFYTDYVDTYGEDTLADTEQVSTRDGGGHGSHTASTAAGNVKGNVITEGRKFGTVSGMAPAAKVAAYKVCWENVDPDASGCFNSDTIAAIDDAVLDGVDVINFSVGGGASPELDATEVAYEGAAEAGIFVATSAGNSGPGASTLDHPSPWLTTVAATTHYNYDGTAVLGNGGKLVGASISGVDVPQTPLVRSEDAAAAGADATAAKLCGPDTLDPSQAGGKIVVCLRGTYDRVAKSAEVKRAGGKAMILVNPPSGGSLDADFHSVPTIHISETLGQRLYTYMDRQGSDATAAFKVGNLTDQVTPLPQVASFSSRGPILVSDGDMLKPDISAPGVSVLAAVAPPSNSGRHYDLYSGTSMASPHIAGLAAFITGLHPAWTPMQIKSAMMTTAKRTKTERGGLSEDALAQGSGIVRPKRFFNPGLFVEAPASQWRGFLTAQGINTGVPAIDAKAINLPSMAAGSVTGSTTFTRSFRSGKKGVWKIAAKVPGFELTSRPSVIRSTRRHDVIDVRFTFTRTTATLGQYAQGAVKLTGPTSLRLPVALQPVSVQAPVSVTGTGTSGDVTVPLRAGFTGDLDLTTSGLAKAQTVNDSIAVNDSQFKCVTVTPDTKVARFDVDAADNTADLDLFVLQADTCDPATAFALAGQSATASADESVTLTDPEPGVYIAEIDGFAAGEQGAPVDYAFDFYDIDPSATLGNLTATPNPVPVRSNEQTSYDLSWSALAPASRYLGLVEYAGSDVTTLLEVSTPAAP